MIKKFKYAQMTRRASPKSTTGKNLFFAFSIGGLICVGGQSFIDLYLYLGLTQDVAAISSSLTLVFLASLFTAIGWYGKLAKIAGAGTLIPITGFANAVSSASIEFKSEGYILGVGGKMFLIVGPVIVYGVTASIIYGLILHFFNGLLS